MEKAKDVGQYLKDEFLRLKEKYQIIGDVRGVGLFVGVHLVKNRETREPNTKVAEHALHRFREEKILMQVDVGINSGYRTIFSK